MNEKEQVKNNHDAQQTRDLEKKDFKESLTNVEELKWLKIEMWMRGDFFHFHMKT